MKKKITSPMILFLSLLSCTVFAQSKSEIGAVASVYDAVANTRVSSYSLKTNSGTIINTEIENYYSKNGQLSVTGKVKAIENSVFFLKGDRTSLYGCIVIHDTRKAYEYTTVNGVLVVEEVPIAKMCPDLYEDFPLLPPAMNGPRDIQAVSYSAMALGQLPHIGPYKNQDLLTLESRPRSKYVYFMDISKIMNGATPKYVTAEQMYINWQCTADQYSMYDVNVTTSRAVYSAAGVPNSGIANFLDKDGRSFATLNSFGTAEASSLFKDAAAPWGYGLGRTTAHEGGHQMGLSHDGGQPGGEYYEGIPAFQWCPIMGNYWFGNAWNEPLYQWSKGEYTGSSQKQDDLTLIQRHVPFLTDDITATKALTIGGAGEVSPKENWAQINSNTDVDLFTFTITGSTGHLTLKLDPIEYISMLDIDARIVNASGTAVAQSNLAVNRSASFDLDLPAGAYKLEIKGGAEGTPQKGFSNYSSMGYYAMEGKITGGSAGIVKTALDNSISIYPNPATDAAYLSIPAEASVSRITLSSILGQTVFEATNKVNSIDLSTLSKGVYVLKIEANNETIIRKINKL